MLKKEESMVKFKESVRTWSSALVRPPSVEGTTAPPNSRRGREKSASLHPAIGTLAVKIRHRAGRQKQYVTYNKTSTFVNKGPL
jgi:hypothetical protein